MQDGTALASWYDHQTHSPNDPHVLAAYEALKRDLWRQFTGLRFAVRFTHENPYQTGDEANAAIAAGTYAVCTDPFDLPSPHPLRDLAPNGETYNTLLRATHDVLGHYAAQSDFTFAGEVAAFRSQAPHFTTRALPAFAAELLGQETAKRFGKIAGIAPFAEQKACVIPFALFAGFLA